ncbi:MAG: 30S ribosomal protein S12 methylthiotransferase RimO [Lachnospiraceae bacterium]|nr:30S ribosomal protein S12 methylthiotransferase RimO [Lachnospiraceae bacterium]
MKIFLNSLGCDKNLCDSEEMLGLLSAAGYSFTDEISEAEIIIINSCCFIGDAQKESIDAIFEAIGYKDVGSCRHIIVAGCLAQRFRGDFLTELPEVDGLLGTASVHRVRELLDKVICGEKAEIFDSLDTPAHCGKRRILCTGGHYAYLKIAEGCGKRCTYCVIPSVRGNYRSVPMEELVREAGRLAAGGVKELILVAQETTLYGVDLYGRKALPQLLSALSEIDGLNWIRLTYCYPEEITDELIRAIADLKKVVHYIDMPIQSASDTVLRAMGRKTTRAQLISTIDRLRAAVPDIVIRTTLISGFPGETEEDHSATMDFIEQMRFDRLGVFTYSKEDGTVAAGMKNQIPKKLKDRRRAELMLLQQKISAEKSERRVGSVLKVFVEGRDTNSNALVGRTYADAPEVDGFIFVDTPIDFMSGDYINVRVTGASEYDLTGEITDD